MQFFQKYLLNPLTPQQHKWAVIYLLPLASLVFCLLPSQAQTGPIQSAIDGTSTLVTPSGNQFDISGGQLSNDGSNLFHSFQQFGLNEGQIANFLSNPTIQNILGRVVGGDASYINGLIQITGGNSNLFLMNPSGIMFGPSAQLNVPASFLVTTATGIGFTDGWFNALGSNQYGTLVGTPNTFKFEVSQPGAIANFGHLRVSTGQTLALLGGTILSKGTLSAPEGQIAIASILGENLVRISQRGHLLNLEVSSLSLTGIDRERFALQPKLLPQLLAGGRSHATEVKISGDGTVQLTDSDLPILPGDVVIAHPANSSNPITIDLNAKTATLSAARNLTLSNTQWQLRGDLQLQAQDTMRLRDSVTNPLAIETQGNLTLQGDRYVEIQAVDHPQSILRTNGNLMLMSRNPIAGNAFFQTGGDFSVITPLGNPAHLISVAGLAIISEGNVTLGDYTGASLQIQTQGAIATGNLTVNSGGITRTSPKLTLLANASPSLETDLTFGVTPSIQVGNITIAGSVFLNSEGHLQTASVTSKGGEVAFTAVGNITTGKLDTSSLTGNAGNITLYSQTGTIDTRTQSVNASSLTGNGGQIFLYAASPRSDLAILTNELNASSTTGNGGNITLYAEGGIQTGNINSSGSQAGVITLLSNQGAIDTHIGVLNAVGMTGGGNVISLNAYGNITTGNITTNGGNITLISQSGGIDTRWGTLASGSTRIGGDIGLLGFDSIAVADIISKGGAIRLNSLKGNLSNQNFDSSSPIDRGGLIDLAAYGNITSGDLLSGGGKIFLYSLRGQLDASTSAINSSFRLGVGGDIGVDVIKDITVRDVISGGAEITFLTGGMLKIGGILNSLDRTGVGNNISLLGTPLIAGNILSGGGEIELKSGSTIQVGNLDSTSVLGKGGPVLVTAVSDLTVSNVNSQGGNIRLASNGNIQVSGDRIDSSWKMGEGGPIELHANQDINVGGAVISGGGEISLFSSSGNINASNSILDSVAGLGGSDGNITLTAFGTINPGTILAPFGSIRLTTSSTDPSSLDTTSSQIVAISPPLLTFGSPPLEPPNTVFGEGGSGDAPDAPPEPPTFAGLAPPVIEFPAISFLNVGRQNPPLQPQNPPPVFPIPEPPTLIPEGGNLVPVPSPDAGSGSVLTVPSLIIIPALPPIPTPDVANPSVIPVATFPANQSQGNVNAATSQSAYRLNWDRNSETQKLASLTRNAAQCLTEEALLGQQGGQALGSVPKNYGKAIACYQQNLELARTIGDRAREGYILNNLGVAYYAIGNYAKAIEYHQQRLEKAIAHTDSLGKRQALNGLGAAYAAIGNYEKSIDYYEQSLATTQSLSSADLEDTTLRNLGLVYYSKKDYQKAVEYQEKSLAISRQQRNRRGEALALTNLGLAHYSLTDYQKAIDYQQQSLAIALDIKDLFVEGRARENLGLAYYAIEDYEKAIASHQQSLEIAQKLSDRHAEGRSLSNLGDALYKAGKLAAAVPPLIAAIEIWESLRANLGSNDLNQINIFETQETTYGILQEVLGQQERYTEALEISERGRAQAFVKLLLARRLSPPADRSQIPEAEPQLKSPDIEQIKKIAKDHQSTIVSYSLIKTVVEEGGERKDKDVEIYIWVIQPTGEISFRRSSLERLWERYQSLPELVSISRCFTTACIRNKRRSQTSEENQVITSSQNRLLDPSLQKLYRFLIEPIVDLLPIDPEARVTFIPHESLFLVPFPALQDPAGKYLIEKHTILTAPSIQVLGLTNQKQQQVGGESALIVGNPTMPKVAFQGDSTPEALQPLPNAEIEAIEIGRLLNSQPLIGDDATEAAVLQRIEQSRIVHFATHGLLDDVEGEGMPGAIALAPTADDNGLLTTSEIFNLDLKAELVVLSACNTGRGRITGDGVIGLSRSFISAGVPSVIVSLWSVPDESTAYLMTEFYQEMQKTPDLAHSLRRAMLKTLVKYPNPLEWAAFTLIGEAS